MDILMLGNSFTSTHQLPEQLSDLLQANVTAHTRGGARLAEHLNPNTRSGQRTQSALRDRHWDYVILQEMSHGPVTARERYLDSVRRLCPLIRSAGATPVIYATWAYAPDSQRLSALGLTFDEMTQRLHAACRQAARENGALLAPVGLRFAKAAAEGQTLHGPDGVHPSEAGARLAAEVLAETIRVHKTESEEPT